MFYHLLLSSIRHTDTCWSNNPKQPGAVASSRATIPVSPSLILRLDSRRHVSPVENHVFFLSIPIIPMTHFRSWLRCIPPPSPFMFAPASACAVAFRMISFFRSRVRTAVLIVFRLVPHPPLVTYSLLSDACRPSVLHSRCRVPY